MERTAREYGVKPGGFSAELVAALLDVSSEGGRGERGVRERVSSHIATRASAVL